MKKNNYTNVSILTGYHERQKNAIVLNSKRVIKEKNTPIKIKHYTILLRKICFAFISCFQCISVLIKQPTQHAKMSNS